MGGPGELTELLARASRGDATAWNAIVDRFASLLWAVARGHRLSQEDAADVVQNSWLKLLDHVDDIAQPEALAGWLATTARYECLALLRKKGREHLVRDDDLATSLVDEQVGALDASLLDDERDGQLWACLGRLSERCRVLLAGVVRAYAPESEVRVESVTTMGGTVFESDMVDQLIEAVSFDPHVISFSGGTRTRGNRPLKSFEMFYEQYLKDRGDETVFVCAAGNDGDEGLFWPAAFDWAVGVGALDDDNDTLAGYSNRRDWVDVYALGTDVVNGYPNGSYTYQEPPDRGLPPATFTNGMASWSGTSFAAPMVAGLVAARLSWNGADARTAWDEVRAVAAADAGAGLAARLRDARAASRP